MQIFVFFWLYFRVKVDYKVSYLINCLKDIVLEGIILFSFFILRICKYLYVNMIYSYIDNNNICKNFIFNYKKY